MSTSLAYIAYEPDPQVPLLSEMVLVDAQSQVQREVHDNLHNEIDSVTGQIADRKLREISQTILGEMLRFFD